MVLHRSPVLTRYAGRAGDHNDRATAGSQILAEALSEILRTPIETIGTPSPATPAAWDAELDAALPDLQRLQTQVARILANGERPITALSRCAAALATLPALAHARPDVVVVWFDAHADLNTPHTTSSGYLGGLAFSGPLGLWNSRLGGGLSTSNAILVGARDIDPPEAEVIDRFGIPVITVGSHAPEQLADAIGGRPVYVHIDCDVLQPGTVPTDYSVPQGMTLEDLRAAAAVIAGSEVVGVEIGELEHSAEAEAHVGSLLSALGPLL